MRKITKIVLHCTATSQNASKEAIQRYWRDTLRWKSPGYHFLIDVNGTIHKLADLDQIANGVAGHNANSVHISYIGGIDKSGKPLDNRSKAQIGAQISILKELKAKYPNAEILGHRDFPNVLKACPSFDVKEWLKGIEL